MTDTNRLKAFIIRVSPTSRKVLGVINHLDLDVSIEVLPSFSGATRSPEYLRVNPNGLVPSLVDEDFVLWESCAIIKYLADLVPGNGLVPVGRREQADMWRWIHWESVHFTRAVSGYFWQSFVKPHYNLGVPDQEAMAASVEEIDSLAPVLDSRLEGRAFIMGEQVTLADFAVGSISDHQRRGRVPLDRYPNIQAWFDRLESLPAWAKCLPPFDDEKRG